jgi:hypothetical protein
MPATDMSGNTITNTNVSVVNDSTRGYVFQLGSNFMSLNVAPQSHSKSFWVSSATPTAGGGNVYSSNNFPIYFGGATHLIFSPAFTSGNLNGLTCGAVQTATWVHYVVTVNATTMNIYVNRQFVVYLRGLQASFT